VLVRATELFGKLKRNEVLFGTQERAEQDRKKHEESVVREFLEMNLDGMTGPEFDQFFSKTSV
jgi:hypothetical protein